MSMNEELKEQLEETRAYYKRKLEKKEEALRLVNESLEVMSDKYNAAAIMLADRGFKESVHKHGLNWYYKWDVDPEYKHRYETVDGRG